MIQCSKEILLEKAYSQQGKDAFLAIVITKNPDGEYSTYIYDERNNQFYNGSPFGSNLGKAFDHFEEMGH